MAASPKIVAHGRIRLSLPLQHSLAVTDRLFIYEGDGAGGAISYATAIAPSPQPAWPGAMENFHADLASGLGGFGFGTGPFGYGEFGYGSQWRELVTESHADGTYRMGVIAEDAAGNAEAAAAVEATVTAAAIPASPSSLIASQEETTLSIAWAASPDDLEAA